MQLDYQQQLEFKVQHLLAQFAEFDMPEIEVFESPESHYRMRAEFRIWHTDDDLFYAMFERDEEGKKQVIRIDDFPTATQSINDLMPILLAEVKANPLLSERLFEIDFLASKHGEMLVSMIYHRQLNEAWTAIAKTIQEKLNIKIIGRSRGQKIVLADDFIIEKLMVNGREFAYKQIENGFTQPNAIVCEKMLSWACDVAQENQTDSPTDLLELYCGNGNFTLPLSQHYRNVLATELAKSSVYAAKWNMAENQIENIQLARLSAEEFTEAYQGKREFRRLKEENIELSNYQFDTVFVDPPRAGIDDDTLALIAQFPQIIYISCNPETLYDNLQVLNETHDIKRFAMFDQFPFTHHVESGVLLVKK
uniref:tRNA (uridine(54)-C5)-methyltransferase TrmA n=1 Tax=uncultured Acinetobacter sp. TaxID=165433 RepID=UPI00260B6D16|nr:tRNA (uridine(54)-C5)-methyltransferase TrmA [uncultured Acinetobacter sp.]